MHVTPSIRLLVNKTNNGVFGMAKILSTQERATSKGVNDGIIKLAAFC
jgi:hypothetical protein